MSVWKTAAARTAAWITRSFNISEADFGRWMDITAGFGQRTAAGTAVSESSAIRNPTVYACWKILSEDSASLPFPVFRRLTRGKERATDHPVYRLLHDQANPEMTAFNFRQAMVGNCVLWGNAYAEIVRDKYNDKIIALWPLMPNKMSPERIADGQLVYRYTLPNGEPKIFFREQIWHMAGLGFDGRTGKSPIALARQGIGLAMAGEEMAAKLFGNGTHFGGFLEHPKKLSTEAYNLLRQSLTDQHGGDGTGLSKAMRLKILEEGMTYKAAQMPMRDAQWLESRKFQKLEIAQFYRMQPHKILSMEEGVSYASIEQQNIDYVVGTLRPWLVMVEQSANMQLFRLEERAVFSAEHVVEGLLRGHSTERGAFYTQQFNVGALSPNEIREMENRNPVDGGDRRFVPLNMVPLNEAGQMDLPADRAIEWRRDGSVIVLPKAGSPTSNAESRAERSIRTRTQTSRQFARMFTDAAERIVKREAKDIGHKAKASFGERQQTEGFQEWLESYYREAPVWIRSVIRPTATSFAEAIAAEAGDEVGLTRDISAQLQKFADDYAAAFAARHALSSRGQIRALVEKAAAADEDPLLVIEERLEEWRERRPAKVAQRETVQQAGAIAKFVYAAAGVTSLRWVAQGSDTCPICQELNGQVVGIEQNFVSAGPLDSQDGSQAPMKIRSPASHPPIHEGCECTISPG